MHQDGNAWKRIGRGRLTRRRLLGNAALAGAGLACFSAAACSRNGRRSPSAQQASSSSNAQAKPTSDAQVRVRLPSDPFDWDMSYTGKSNPNQYGAGLAYESLLSFKTGADIKYEQVAL